jgi:putative methionine-R-sulfoxide reductase with GAF domain
MSLSSEENTNKINNLSPELQRSYQRMIEEINHLTTNANDLTSFYNAIVDGIQRVSNCYSVNLFIVDIDKTWAVLEAVTGKTGSLSQKALQRRHKLAINGNSLVSRVVNTRSACIAKDQQEDETMLFSSVDLTPIHSELCVPLISLQENVVGVLDIQSSEYEAFHVEECFFYMAVAEYIVSLLDEKKFLID